MDALDLGPPIATLRTLGALSKDSTSAVHNQDSTTPTSTRSAVTCFGSDDPVLQGVLSMRDAQKAINMYSPLLSLKSADVLC